MYMFFNHQNSDRCFICKEGMSMSEENKPPLCYYCGKKVDEDFQEGYERVAHGDCIDMNSDDLSWEILQ